MSAPTLVTGATGFVGSAVARNLIEQGFPVRLMVRKGSDRSNIADIDAELVEGDLKTPESFDKALQGCRYLFHVAADYRLWVPDPAPMMQANVEGTRRLMLAAQKANIEKIVYCSSVAALGLIGDGSIADENTPVREHSVVGIYKRSKYRAEQEVIKLAKNEKLPATIVNPSTPVGPRDIKPTPTGQMILDAAAGRMPAYVDTGVNIVHVDDVAKGHILALKHGRIGEKYILGGENFHLKELFEMISEIVHKPPPRICIPRPVIWPFAVISEWLARGFGVPPRVTREMLAMSKKKMFFSSDKAKKELGYRPRPAKEAIIDAIDWFRENGRLG